MVAGGTSAKAHRCGVICLGAEIVEVEVDTSRGLMALNVVGLPEKPIQEARERVRAAIRNSGYSFSNQRITVNLAPADLRKEGPPYETVCRASRRAVPVSLQVSR